MNPNLDLTEDTSTNFTSFVAKSHLNTNQPRKGTKKHDYARVSQTEKKYFRH